MDAVGSGDASIRRGHSGQDVRSLQRMLNEAGARPPLDEDGLFGPKTQAAVRRFQRSAHMSPSGSVDRSTLGRLRDRRATQPAEAPRGPAGTTPRAPHVDQRAPAGTLPARDLSQRDQAQRDLRRRRSQPDARPRRTREADAPRSTPTTPNAPAPNASAPNGRATPGRYDGRTPAPETTSTRASRNVEPPLTNSQQQGRSRETYDQVINQFAVGDNPRYARRNGNTYCNIFASDVTRAMGAPIPHWVQRDGTPAEPFERGAHEMNANATNRWLNQHGATNGWRQVSAEDAQRHASAGRPAVASRANPGGIGHIAVVRPGEITDRGPAIAQAGGRNFNEGHVGDVWRRSQPEYWVHD